MKFGYTCLSAALLLAFAPMLRAQDVELRAFNAAAKSFQDESFEIAEKQFAGFVVQYTNSARRAQAILFQAQAAFQQKKVAPALELLSAQLPQAGQLADEYRFWHAKMLVDSGEAAAAAREFAQVVAEFPKSSRRLEASYGEALALFRLRRWADVVQRLRDPAGPFQTAVRAAPDDAFGARGQLLLARALIEQQELAAAEQALKAVRLATGALAWERLFLLCRVQLSRQQVNDALGNTTNLIALAAATPALQADSYLLQAQILEALRQYAPAMAAYGLVQSEGMPAEKRREAFLRAVELALGQNRLEDAILRLESFFARYPQDAASDVGQLSLGELRLRQHLAPAAASTSTATNLVAGTNALQQALAHFDRVVREFPQSPLLGKAQLNRGWTLLMGGRTAESLPAFKAAAEALTPGQEQAIARFKLAEVQLLLNDPTNSVATFRSFIETYRETPALPAGLLDRAFYQMVRAGLAAGDSAVAHEAMRKAMERFPASLFTEQAMVLYGQGLSEARKPAEARSIFEEFLRRFPESSLRAPVELAIARSFELERDWSAAAARYDAWVQRHRTNALASEGEFARAFAYYRAGRETNALMLFTNLVAQRPPSALTARAQDWVGDYYFRNEDYVGAERQYQRLFGTNWPATDPVVRELSFRAQLKAGRAALFRQNPADAIGYFTNLLAAQCPPGLAAETFFAYGDTRMAEAQYAKAIEVFNKIPQLYPSDPLVPRAWGQIGNCHLQLAAQDPRSYTNALSAYEKAMQAPADVSTRSEAEVAMGLALMKQAGADTNQLRSALEHFQNVLYEANLADGEQPDLFWVKRAGLAAAEHAEAQKRWSQAIKYYQRIEEMLPALRPTLDKRIEWVRQQPGADRD